MFLTPGLPREMQKLSRKSNPINCFRFTVVLCWRLVCTILVYIVLSGGEMSLKFAYSNPGVQFRDVTLAAGIDFVHSRGSRSSLLPEDMGSGAGFADYDNDGDLDLYIVNNPGPLEVEISSESSGNILYRNNGDGTFSDVTEKAGVGDRGYGMGCVFGDYDNDGDVDLYVTNFGHNVLYRNNGDGSFSDVTESAGVCDGRWGTGAIFGDYDRDGDLDLYVCNYVDYDLAKIEEMKRESKQGGKSVPSALNPIAFEAQDNVLFRNDGDGTFTDVTAKLEMEANGGRSMQAIFTDFDLDGDLDLYVANDLTPNFVYENSGDGTFADVSSESWAADFRGSMGLATGDYDSDGDLDLFISHWIDQENTLYRNLCTEGSEISSAKSDKAGPIQFIDESYGSLLAEISMKDIGWGTDFFDYDNDADLDIFVANGSTFQYLEMPKFLIRQKDRLFRNERDGSFIDVAGEVGVGALPSRVGRGVAFGDYDNDGDVDVFVVNNHDRAVLLRNDGGNRNAWLQVKLVGTMDNRDGVGSKIRVVAGDLTQIREINAGASYMSFNSLTAEFGLGQESMVDVLEVVWQNGTTERFSDVHVNQSVVITQGNGIR